ncbi:hypothetical protein BKP37_01655 [Anaerobacillus alkalilacustris]|uniref:Uncharacterized protein n=1 Tax=Anaerobacillus alkalilacustris TaxID=393763 RepID=A0A1S2LY11_9BACI|nr:hypothetical protein BKP37_01655 [Anaerobacillus alkalilacustris]
MKLELIPLNSTNTANNKSQKNSSSSIRNELPKKEKTGGYGLKSMATQAKLTALAVNLKRIARLLSSLNAVNSPFLFLIFIVLNKFSYRREIKLKVG